MALGQGSKLILLAVLGGGAYLAFGGGAAASQEDGGGGVAPTFVAGTPFGQSGRSPVVSGAVAPSGAPDVKSKKGTSITIISEAPEINEAALDLSALSQSKEPAPDFKEAQARRVEIAKKRQSSGGGGAVDTSPLAKRQKQFIESGSGSGVPFTPQRAVDVGATTFTTTAPKKSVSVARFPSRSSAPVFRGVFF